MPATRVVRRKQEVAAKLVQLLLSNVFSLVVDKPLHEPEVYQVELVRVVETHDDVLQLDVIVYVA